MQTSSLVREAAAVVCAYVANNRLPADELAGLLGRTYATFVSLGGPAAPSSEPTFRRATPAQIRASIRDDALISFIDGKPYLTLRRHLRSNGLDDAAYRERYGLPVDYPMVSPAYSRKRRELAIGLGLGERRRKYRYKGE